MFKKISNFLVKGLWLFLWGLWHSIINTVWCHNSHKHSSLTQGIVYLKILLSYTIPCLTKSLYTSVYLKTDGFSFDRLAIVYICYY